MSTNLLLPASFKAYDIRGRMPDELNPEIAYAIGRAYAEVVQPHGPVAVGEDIRLTSPELANAVSRGLNTAGVDTCRLGLCGSETVYHAAARPGMGGGIMVTASHNPADYNGMKMVRAGAVPISGDSGLCEIGRRVAGRVPSTAHAAGQESNLDVLQGLVDQLLGFVDPDAFAPLHLVVNAGNGAAGPTFDALARHLPLKVTRIHHEPDGSFPNGIPNPLLPENREVTARTVRESRADLGIAWDGDFDRCFFFDELGRCIEGYYLVGLLAAQMLKYHPGAKVIHDPRLIWNTIEMVTQAGGIPIMSKTGHAFIKERMRAEGAIYGGEMSAHHYFQRFAYCDSGMVPWLMVVETLSRSCAPLSSLVEERMLAFPCSGEINFVVDDPARAIRTIEEHFAANVIRVDRTDGLSMEWDDWRFNLRSSNTEPLLRLNVETRADTALLNARTQELGDLIRAHCSAR